MSCELGNLYNKEDVIRHILRSSSSSSSSFSHLVKLRDVVELKLTDNPSYLTGRTKDGSVSAESVSKADTAPYMCPLTLIPMNGQHRFVYIRTCGCVLSERALREVKGDVCALCSKAYTADDVVPIYGEPDEVAALRAKMDERRAKSGGGKKEKRERAKEAEEAGEAARAKKAKEEFAPSLLPESVRKALASSGSMEGKSDVYKSLFSKEGEKQSPAALFQGTHLHG